MEDVAYLMEMFLDTAGGKQINTVHDEDTLVKDHGS